MPHCSVPPSSTNEILATADFDPEWTAILETSPLLSGADYDVDMLKDLSAATYPRIKKLLTESRPVDVVEEAVTIDIPSTDLCPKSSRNRAIIVFPNQQIIDKISDSSAVILLFHGGGHTVGTPEQELLLARQLVQRLNAVVVLPSYRLAPEYVFPCSFNDCFETLKQIANDIVSLSNGLTKTGILPKVLSACLSRKSPLIIGGTSAGAAIAASLTHLYHNYRTSPSGSLLPSLSGLFFSCGTVLDQTYIPAAYKPYYLSRKQNASCLPFDQDLAELFYSASKPNRRSPIWASLDQHPELNRQNVGEDHRFLKDDATRVYIQACGADVSRDDALIYGRVLREEVGVETRLDIYSGFGHVFWGMSGGYSELNMSKTRMKDTIDGMNWLVKSSKP